MLNNLLIREQGAGGGKPWFAVFANFCGVTIPSSISANNMILMNMSMGIDAHRQLFWASGSWL